MTRLAGATGRNKGEAYPGGGSGGSGGGSSKVRVSAVDATADYLDVKVIPGSNVTVTPVDLGGGVLALSIAADVPPGSSDHKVLVDGADTTAGFLAAKIVAGAAIALAVLSPGGDEQISVAVSDLRNAQVAADAAIAGTKISPNFGSQAVSTTGTLSAGATTVTSLTDTALGLGVVHSGVGGAFTSSLIVNADVATGAAIAGTKIDPDFGSQNIVTLGTLSAGSATFSGVTISSFITGVIHSNGSGVLSSSLIVNADVATAAAIAGTKISPNFGSQTIQTTGPLDVGAATATSLTVSSLGLGVVHSSGGGVFSSSLIVNADISGSAAITVTKLAPGTNGQVLQTAGGVAAWALLPAGSLTPGAANTVLVTNGAATATAFALLVNANVDAAAAVAGTKISPDFGAQDIATTGNILFGSTSSFIRFGAVGSNPTTGNIRVPDQFAMYGLSAAATAARLLHFDSSSGGTLALGNNNANDVALTRMKARTRIRGELTTDATQFWEMTVGNFQLGSAITVLNWASQVVNPVFSVATAVAGNGTLLTIHGQNVSANSAIAGATLVQGGDAVSGVTDVGGDRWDRPGTGVTRGNHAFQCTAIPSWNSMQFGAFWGNASAIPVGNPTAGHYSYVSSGARVHRGPTGAVTLVSAG